MNCIVFQDLKQRDTFLRQAILNLSKERYFCLLQTVNGLNERYPTFEYVIGSSPKAEKLKEEDFDRKRWLLGGFSYSFKEEVEPVCVNHQKASIEFPNVAFFEPEVVLYVKKKSL